MKKLLLLTLFITLTFIGFSQFPGNLSGYYIKALTAVVISGDTLSNTTQLSLSDTTAATKGYVDLIGSPWPTDTVQFTTDQVGLPYKEGRLYYDANKGNPVFFGSEPDVSLDIGRELWIEINNPTAGTLTNGKLVYFSGGASGKNANINLADNRYWETVSAIGMLTHDIETGTFGLTTTNGTVHDITTIGETEGDEVYVGHNGDWTTARPVYPEFEYEVGFIQYAATDSGSIYIAPKGQIDDIFHNLSAGSIIEDFDFTISSTGSVITGELNAEPGARDSLTFFFSDSYSTLATPVTIVLSAGTDASEQINYTYILKSTKALANSTAYWPAVEHIPISISSLQSAATTLTRDIVRNQNMISHTADIHTQMGRLDHISKRIRTLPAKFLKGSGANLTVTGSGTTTVTLSTTSAKVWQLHLDNFDAIDISTDYLIVPNDDTSPGTWINDLTDITTDATGASLNNKYFTVVIGGIQNSATEPDHLYMMMPEGSYNSSDAAVANGDGYTNYVVPDNYDGVGFLMYALTFGASSTSTVWTLTNTVNLRGLFPNTVAGAGSSGGTGDEAYTDHSDTPNSFVGDGNKFVRVASGETALEHVAASIINVSDFNDDGTYFHKTNDDSDDIIEGVVNLFNQTHTSEVTGSGALTIASGVIDEDNLDATNVPTDNYVLSYNLAGTNFTWVPSVSGATQLSELSDVVSATNTNRFALMANGTTGYVGRAVVEADISDLTHTDGDAIHDNINGEINAIAIKTSPTTSDILVIEDAAVSFSKKKITLGAFETLISGSFLPYTGATGSLTMGENDIATRQLTMGTATAPDATITARDDLTLAGGSGVDGSASIL
ncbi:MAG: hypothetical protein KAS32_28635, partial [Candidatus Peribacteraceae bacterium]|nr:hypothetical protein [Candidatus Peribacteraceae bacterium]